MAPRFDLAVWCSTAQKCLTFVTGKYYHLECYPYALLGCFCGHTIHVRLREQRKRVERALSLGFLEMSKWTVHRQAFQADVGRVFRLLRRPLSFE